MLIAVAALEAPLREFVAGGGPTSKGVLADLAFGRAGVLGQDPQSFAALKDLFRLRDKIAHESAEATPKQAEDALLLVRNTLERIAQRRAS